MDSSQSGEEIRTRDCARTHNVVTVISVGTRMSERDYLSKAVTFKADGHLEVLSFRRGDSKRNGSRSTRSRFIVENASTAKRKGN